MGLGETMEILAGVELFSGFPEEPLRLIAFGAEPIRRRKGQRLFTVGAPAFTGLIVVEGSVELRSGADRTSPPLAMAGPGALIGEMALISETMRPATAVMAEDGVLLEIPRLLMRRVLEEYPQVAEVLRANFAERLATTMRDLDGVRALLEGDKRR